MSPVISGSEEDPEPGHILYDTHQTTNAGANVLMDIAQPEPTSILSAHGASGRTGPDTDTAPPLPIETGEYAFEGVGDDFPRPWQPDLLVWTRAIVLGLLAGIGVALINGWRP